MAPRRPTSSRRSPRPPTAASPTRSSCAAASTTEWRPAEGERFPARAERDFRIGSYGTSYFRSLLGSEACSKARCDLPRGVIVNDRTGTITLHLHKADPEFLSKPALPAAYPVPREVSMTKRERLGVPGTGPYPIQSYQKQTKKVARPRTRAQPALPRDGPRPHNRPAIIQTGSS